MLFVTMGAEHGLQRESKSEEEVGAESIMTPEQRRMSEERAEFDVQEQPPWEDFEENSVDENYERRKPTVEEKERMDRTMEELGQLMSQSDVRWQLDGAINIPLLWRRIH